MAKICMVDVETTGTDPARHQLWEIGLVVRRPDTEDAEYCWQVAPDLSTADPMALKVGRYYRRNRLNYPDEAFIITDPEDENGIGGRVSTRHVAAHVASLLADSVLVAANVAFDAAFIEAFLRRNNQAPAWNYHLVEIESMAAGALGVLPPWKLDQFLTACDITVPDDKRHTALGDALAVRDLYDAVAGRGAR